MSQQNTLPPAEQWWPGLDVDAKHWILANLDEDLPPDVAQAIADEAGVELPETGPWRLSDDDVQFIETQGEAVD